MIGTNIPGLNEFLTEYPEMSLAPTRGNETILKGIFSFSAQPKGKILINDSYRLRIVIPWEFPKITPEVFEIGRKIPRDGQHHVNPDDTLCLTSPLRLRQRLQQDPTLDGFTRNCLLPYLYNISHKIKYGSFPFGELAHGIEGEIADYLVLFNLKIPEQVIKTLFLLGIKKRIANKKSCPCGCGKRLGVCHFHYKVNNFRKLAYRSWFKIHLNKLGSMK